MTDHLLYEGTFDRCPNGEVLSQGWWAEGGQRVWVEDGRLWVKANPPEKGAPGSVCTVWCPVPFDGDITVEFDACSVASTVEANNINAFLHYAHPEGHSLYDTRHERTSGEYALYHGLNGYIATFLNDWTGAAEPHSDGTPRARARLRRCPGFELLAETFDYRCRRGTVYHLAIAVRGREFSLTVDGHLLVRSEVAQPWTSGLIGLRTFQTELWWDNVRVSRPCVGRPRLAPALQPAVCTRPRDPPGIGRHVTGCASTRLSPAASPATTC